MNILPDMTPRAYYICES